MKDAPVFRVSTDGLKHSHTLRIDCRNEVSSLSGLGPDGSPNKKSPTRPRGKPPVSASQIDLCLTPEWGLEPAGSN